MTNRQIKVHQEAVRPGPGVIQGIARDGEELGQQDHDQSMIRGPHWRRETTS